MTKTSQHTSQMPDMASISNILIQKGFLITFCDVIYIMEEMQTEDII